MHMQLATSSKGHVKLVKLVKAASIKKVGRYLTDYLQATVVDLVVVVAVNNNNYH